eukprot:m.846185 g.846185  ORF g.846185 m.846185 type:complete len:515 (-) comp59556_c0_seq9:90-1634(-)
MWRAGVRGARIGGAWSVRQSSTSAAHPRVGGIAALRLLPSSASLPSTNTVSFITEEQISTYPPHLRAALTTTHQAVLPVADGSAATHLLVSLGPQAKVSAASLRGAASKAVKYFRSLKVGGALTLNVPTLDSARVQPAVAAGVLAQSALLSNYTFDKYLGKPAHVDLSEIVLAGVDPALNANLEAIKQATDATIFARDLANERADIASPDLFHTLAQEIADRGQLKLSAVVGEELPAQGLNLLHAVGQASRYPSRLLMLEHWGDKENAQDVTLIVGKGITFDTGGLNLKPTGSMETMHLDKSGAVVALAAADAVARAGLRKNVVFVLALAENCIGSRAYKPHAIIKSHKGLTVEIGNTDAEGRLALADALSFTQAKYKPHTVIDLATLTGACVVGLGEYAAGLFSNDDALAKALAEAGDAVHERLWRLPILPEHEEELKNVYADTSSTGKGRFGGASTAAAFLKLFINDNVKWAHLDIAGPAMYSKPSGHFPEGGTGFGVHLILQYLAGSAASR